MKMNPFFLSFGLLMIFLIFGGVLCKPQNRLVREAPKDYQRELKFVHVIMRHSVRSPVSLYPKDPHFNNEFLPNGRGQITMKGIERAYNYGKYLRKRYDSFLGPRYNVTEFYAESTGVERAQATIMTVNTALWLPQKEQRFKPDFDYFPVPVFMTNLDDDMLLLVAKDCPQYNLERKRVEESSEAAEKLKPYKSMMEIIEKESGQVMKTFDDIGDIYATMLAEKNFDLELPEWVTPHFDQMEKAAAYSFVIKAYNEKMQRFKGGVLLKKLLADWQKKIAGQSPKKMILYGGHDSTMANLLSALKIFDPQVPDYAMTIFLELSYDTEDKKYGLEVFVKNSTADPIQMTIPGCEKFCPIEDLIKLTKNVIPGNWEEECATDDESYVPPPFEGP